MTAVQLLLNSQFPHIHSLQDTLKQDLGKMEPMPTGLTSLQILLINHNHWIVASSIDTDITLYDSKYSFLHKHTELLLSQLAFTKKRYFTVSIGNVNKQAGDNDCGLIAAAYITSIAHGQDPSSVVYNQGLLRQHLFKCLEAKKMDLFPIVRKRRVLPPKIVKVEVYCYCRLPNDGKEMVQCSKKGCKEWFHLQCIKNGNSNVTLGQKWFCNNCK